MFKLEQLSINADQQKRKTDSNSNTREAHFFIPLLNASNTSLFFISKKVLTRFLFFCTSAFSLLCLNLLLSRKSPSFYLSCIILI